MSWRGVLVIVLLAAAVISGWSAWRQGARVEQAAAGPVRSDYVLRDFELIALDGTGAESFTLRAPHLAQTPGERSIEIETPLFLIPDGDGDYWNARSRTAWIAPGHDQVQLRGQVRVRAAEASVRQITMDTEHLTLFPETDIASSDDLVTVAQPGSTIQGRGMEVDLSTKRYEFRSEVKTRYVPTRR